jgi:hypothetical protein
MAKRWVLGLVTVNVLVVVGAIWAIRDPLVIPGEHEVEVYTLDDRISPEVTEPPALLGRLLGRCDADSYYARDGDRKLCLVLDGPRGTVKARKKDGRVVVKAADVPRLRELAGQDTTIVLMAGGPAALIPVASLRDGQPVEANALS